MDRNDLLTATRVEFLRAFSAAMGELLPLSEQRLFDRADRSMSSREQRQLLEAHTAIITFGPMLLQQSAFNLEQLLNRAFRTAYSNFRPSFNNTTSFKASSLSLVDSNELEGELRIDQLSQRYRNAADEQLRDLNIRVALLFDQENIKERENPFRPYLVSRALITTVDQLGLEDELAYVLGDQLSDDLTDKVTALYARLNDLLAQHGIAAELRAKITRAPTLPHPTPEPVMAQDDDDVPFDLDEQGPPSQTFGKPRQSGYAPTHPTATGPSSRFGQAPQQNQAASQPAYSPQSYDTESAEQTTAASFGGGRVGQLMQRVRQGASRLSGGSPSMAHQGQASQADASATRDPDSGFPAQVDFGDDEPQIASPSTAARGGLAQMAQAGWLAGTEMMGNALRKFFSTGNAMGMPTSPLTSNTQARRVLTTSVNSMQRTLTPAAEEMFGDDGEVRNLIMEQRPSLNEMAKGMNEQMIIDVVAMLFDFILRDDQVPAEVRAQLGRLQFLVLKIALMDPELFTQKHHPARVLVNRIGSISLGLEKAGANTEAMVAEIRQIIERLLADEHENVGLFSRMLDEFDTFIARQLRSADEKIERAVAALETAENRTLHFARTTASIAEALQGLTLDPYLHNFLLNAWAHAVERATRDDIARAEKYWMLIPDLIWSIAPKVSKAERDQLLVQIPGMLRTLREGIERIGWDTGQQQSLINWLIDAHTHAMRVSSTQVAVPTIQQMRARFQTDAKPSAEAKPETKASRGPLNRQVLDQTIRELEVELNLLDRVLDQSDETQPASNDLEADGALGDAPVEASPAADQAEIDVLERLRSGVSVEVNLGGKPSLAKLNWISPGESSLILSIDGDHKPAVVSVRLFLRLMSTGRAKFVEVAPLFERAVQSLLITADLIDRDNEEASAPA